MNRFARTKNPAGSKFSEIFFKPLYAGRTVLGHLYCGFSLLRQMVPQQSAKFRTAFFGQFPTSLRKDSVANYASIWTLLSMLVTGRDIFCNALNSSQIRLQVAPQDSQNCSRNFAQRKQSDAEFAGKYSLRGNTLLCLITCTLCTWLLLTQ